MVLGAGSTLSSGFSPGREEPVSGAREPEESWQDRGRSGAEQSSPGSQRWAPLLPQVERTEVLRSCSSPVFSRVLALEYFFEEKQPLQFHVWASYCTGFSCCRKRALGCTGFSSRSAEHRLSSCGTWA